LKRREVERRVQESIQELLDDELSVNHTFRYTPSYADDRHRMKLELNAMEKDVEEGRRPQSILVLRIVFLHDLREIQIPNIFMPDCMKRSRLGKRTIKAIHDVGASFDYELFITDLTQSFFDRLLKRGAVQMNESCVQITAATDLTSDVGSPIHVFDESQELTTVSIFDFLKDK
jgi:hypothetical protein